MESDQSNPLGLTQDVLGEVVAYVFQASSIEHVTDSETSETARLLRAKLKDVEVRIERARVSAKAPFLQSAKQIDGLANVIFDQVRPQIARLDQLRLAYSQAYAKPQAPVVIPVAADDLSFLGVPDMANLAQAVSAEPPVIRTRTTKDIQILDPSRIPDEFWVLDETKLRQAVLRDKRDVPGVIIIEKQSVLE